MTVGDHGRRSKIDGRLPVFRGTPFKRTLVNYQHIPYSFLLGAPEQLLIIISILNFSCLRPNLSSMMSDTFELFLFKQIKLTRAQCRVKIIVFCVWRSLASILTKCYSPLFIRLSHRIFSILNPWHCRLHSVCHSWCCPTPHVQCPHCHVMLRTCHPSTIYPGKILALYFCI